ncbi:MAG: hypothetical protein ACSLEN_04785 [Candidatus Malihini olakiniferum]
MIISRSVTHQLQEEEFVAAAKTLGIVCLHHCAGNSAQFTGASHSGVIVRDCPRRSIGSHARLSWTGGWCKPPMPSWGLIIAEG